MKKTKTAIILFLFLAGAIGLHALAAASGNEATPPAIKTAGMNAQGTVVQISESVIRIERRIKESSEVMDFECGAPTAGISIGDTVKIVYTQDKGKLLAVKIVRVSKEPRRATK